MGISFGSASKKPYVGSKEVTEAYVGSQLVYKASYPYKYAFLGTENDYMLADWCTIGQKVAIAKWLDIFRIVLPYTGSPDANENIVILNDIDSTKYKVLKYTHFVQKPTATTCTVIFGKGSTLLSRQYYNFPSVTEKALSFNIPDGTTTIRLIGGVSLSSYLDAIRIEE